MANLTTNADILDESLDQVGELTDGNSDYESNALIYYNRVFQMLAAGGVALNPVVNEDWWWLRKHPPGSLVLQPKITTGTLSVTKEGVSITFSSAPAASVAGWFLKVDTHVDIFRITAHTGGATGATIDVGYTGDTSATAAYKIFKLEYDLATDVFRAISPMRVFRGQFAATKPGEIDGMDLRALESQYPLKVVAEGVPAAWAIIQESSATPKVRFSHYADALSRVEYDYLFVPSDLADDGNSPIVPRLYRHILVDGTAYFLAILKNDTKADTFGLLMRNGIAAMATENRQKTASIGRSYGKIFPRADLMSAPHTGRRFRTESGMLL